MKMIPPLERQRAALPTACLAALLCLASACSDNPAPPTIVGCDCDPLVTDAEGGDPYLPAADGDASPADSDHTPVEGDDSAPSCLPPEVDLGQVLGPVPGELYYQQLGLGGLSMGESAVLVGPDGTVMLIDVGNNSHDDNVREALNSTIDAMTGAGFTPRGHDRVDRIILTHEHADHADGLEDLLGAITVTQGIVRRGDCPVGSSLALGEGSSASFLAANGCAGAVGQTCLAPLPDTDDGENARSIVLLLRHGAFRMLAAGDLTGGGSDSPDAESFLAPLLCALPPLGPLGVDVLHVNHHGRRTSTSLSWAEAFLPSDGRSRNAVFAISTAHALSPHQEVLDTLFGGQRLAAGFGWTTRVAVGGASAAKLLSAEGGPVVLRTVDSGAYYAIQAISEDGVVLQAGIYPSVRTCQP